MYKTVIFLFASVFVPLTVFAQEAPAPAVEDGLDLVTVLISAAQGGQWSLFASVLIMFLVWLATRAPVLKDLIKGEAKIWVAAVAGVLAAVAASAVINNGDWLKAIIEGLSVGLAAGGLWSIVGRKILGKAVDADGDGVLDAAE
tara:strand:- start:8060 stop:8491 length:432 start_codon:yes stop_codon:yes gene_type:complete